MTSRRTVLGLACAASLAGACQEQKTTELELPPELHAHVFDSVPSNIPNRTFIDFEGKLHLIGYSVEPEQAAPGSRIKLTTYWKSVSPLRTGWSLFTHVLDHRGVQFQNVDNEGPLRAVIETAVGERQAWPPSLWQPGKVYVDKQEFQLDPTTSPEVTIGVGVWRGTARLAVISGPKDRANRGLVVRLQTGVVRPAPGTPKS